MDRPSPPPVAVPAPPPAEPRSRAGLAAGLVVTLAAVAAAVLFAAPNGEDGQVVLQAVALHSLPPEQLAPAILPDAAAPRDSFSDFARRAGWLPTGARADRVAGREAATVFWERGGHRVAYTLLSGAPAEPPEGSRRTGRGGVLLHSFEAEGRTAVTWVQDGAGTVVISSAAVPRTELYDLAGGPGAARAGPPRRGRGSP